MKKLRFWGYMVCFAMLLTLVLAASTKVDAENNTTYTLDADGTLTVYCEGVCNGVPLTEAEWENVKTIVFAEGVTEIGDDALGAYWNYTPTMRYTSVTLPEGLQTVGDYAFMSVKTLTEVHLPDSLTEIGYGAFAECGITEVTIPKGVTSLTEAEFCGNPLTSVIFHENFTELGEFAFSGTALETVALPDSLTKIGSRAFAHCEKLRSVTIPEGVTAIGAYAFWDCGALEKMALPSTLMAIDGTFVWEASPELQITLRAGSDSFLIEADILYSADKTALVRYPAYKKEASFSVPDSVTEIYPMAFYGCKNLQEILLPDGLKTIGGMAFSGCDALQKITIPESVEKFGEVGIHGGVPEYSGIGFGPVNAFYESGLQEIVVRSRTADATAWYLYESWLPEGVILYCYEYSATDLGDKDARKEYGVTDPPYTIRYLEENNTTYTLDADGTLTVYCKGVCNGVPLTEAEWENVKTIVFAEGVTEIGEAAFAYLDVIEVVLPKGMTVLGYGAFYECTELASVTLPETLLEIGEYAFCHTAIESIKLPASLNKIGGAAFAECYNLRSLTVPEGVLTLGSAVLWGCGALQELYLPASLTSIGESAFRDTDPALRVRLSADNAHYCTLDDVLFTKDMKTLVRYPAYKTDTAYTVPDGVETIFGEAFYGAKSLVSLTLPAGLKTIGGKAFADCKNLKKIVIPESVTALGTVGAALRVPQFAMSGNYSMGPFGDSCFAEIVVLSRTVDVTASRWGDMHIPAGVKIYCYHYSETDKGARQAKEVRAMPEFTLAYLDEDHEHSYTEQITVEPSCTAEGEKVRTCSICGWTETEGIAKLEHTIGEPKITPATCIYEGEKLFTCTGCTYSYSEKLPKVEHPYPKWDLSNISCVESNVSRKCAYCGRIQTMNLCGNLHAYGAWEQTKKPTLGAVGEEQCVCTACGDVQVREVPEMSVSEVITPYVYILDALLVVILLVLLLRKKKS